MCFTAYRITFLVSHHLLFSWAFCYPQWFLHWFAYSYFDSLFGSLFNYFYLPSIFFFSLSEPTHKFTLRSTSERVPFKIQGKSFINKSMYICTCGPGSVVGIATAYGLNGPGIESRWGEIFRTCPDRPRGPPSLLYSGYRVFPGGKVLPGRDADPSPPSSAEV